MINIQGRFGNIEHAADSIWLLAGLDLTGKGKFKCQNSKLKTTTQKSKLRVGERD
jgi:hypothetical protein